jgi:hypothetical protein
VFRHSSSNGKRKQGESSSSSHSSSNTSASLFAVMIFFHFHSIYFTRLCLQGTKVPRQRQEQLLGLLQEMPQQHEAPEQAALEEAPWDESLGSSFEELGSEQEGGGGCAALSLQIILIFSSVLFSLR